MKNTFSIVAVLLGLAALTLAARAATENIALDGTAIMGGNNGADLTTLGFSYQHSNTGGQFTDINDGVTVANAGSYTSTDDTWGASVPYSYVGIEWTPAQLASFSGQAITSLNLYMYVFSDGGWFGKRDTGLDNGKIDASELIAPQVQILTTASTSWVDVNSTSNYTSSVANGGLADEGQGDTPALTFTLNSPVSLTNLEGIRLIGMGGGVANDGFMGVNELQVEAPEPSTCAMLFAGIGALVLLPRLRRLALK